MIPENLILISAQPHDIYFQWQVEVQITNFRKFGISDKMHILVWHPHGSQQLGQWDRIQRKYPEVKIFIYPDFGVDLGLYIPQLRPHILAQHFELHEEELKDKVFFYHDSDIIFNTLPDFETLCADDVNYTSDTSSYLDYTYLRNKEIQGKIPENEAIGLLARIGNISVDKIKEHTGNTGGAQSLLKNIDANFWRDVEQQCVAIRRAFFHGCEGSVNRRYFPDENTGFQSWCADMWALNFALWNRGRKVNTTPLLDFSWATDNLETFKKKPIFHNAGATGTDPNIFYKGQWIGTSPIGQPLALPPAESASAQYVKSILEVPLD